MRAGKIPVKSASKKTASKEGASSVVAHSANSLLKEC
ncbi:hypothetical protein PC116_g27275 [Phytophthora cactorum]|nr:hypothetical protein PC116_g27275 [Phytophthora cactorum]